MESLKAIKVLNKQFPEFVFLCRKGGLSKIAAHGSALFKLCDKAGISRLSIDVLSHAAAARCIEGGCAQRLYKLFQVIPASIQLGLICLCCGRGRNERGWKNRKCLKNCVVKI